MHIHSKVFVSLCVCTLFAHRKLSCALVTVSLTSPSRLYLSRRDLISSECVCLPLFQYAQETSDYSDLPVMPFRVTGLVDPLKKIKSPLSEIVIYLIQYFIVVANIKTQNATSPMAATLHQMEIF